VQLLCVEVLGYGVGLVRREIESSRTIASAAAATAGAAGAGPGQKRKNKKKRVLYCPFDPERLLSTFSGP